MPMRLIKNEVMLEGWFYILLPVVTLPLMMIPLRAARAVLDKIFCGWGGFRVIACSHNVAVYQNNLPVIRVKDREYC